MTVKMASWPSLGTPALLVQMVQPERPVRQDQPYTLLLSPVRTAGMLSLGTPALLVQMVQPERKVL
jgi:hypothetical protein